MEFGKLFLCLVLLIKTTSLLSQTKKPFIRFVENGKYGLVDTSGNVIVEGFDDLDKNWEGFISASKNGLVYVLNDDFKVIFQGEYESIAAGASKKQFIVQKDEKFGVVDSKHKIILPIKYDHIRHIGDYYLVRLGKLYGIVNAKSKIVIPIMYKSIYAKNINKSIPIQVEDEDGKKLIDIKNRMMMSLLESDSLISATENFMIVRIMKGTFLLNAKGEKIIGPFKSIYHFKDVGKKVNKDFILVGEESGKYRIYNSRTLKLLGIYDDISIYGSDLPTIQKEGKYGFVNEKGELFISPQYDNALGFNEGLAPVIKEGKWGVINEQNEIVIPFQLLDFVMRFKNGVAVFKNGPVASSFFTRGENGLINTKGKIIAEPIYSVIEYVAGNKAIVEFDDDKYLYDFVKKEKIKKLEDRSNIHQMVR